MESSPKEKLQFCHLLTLMCFRTQGKIMYSFIISVHPLKVHTTKTDSASHLARDQLPTPIRKRTLTQYLLHFTIKLSQLYIVFLIYICPYVISA